MAKRGLSDVPKTTIFPLLRCSWVTLLASEGVDTRSAWRTLCSGEDSILEKEALRPDDSFSAAYVTILNEFIIHRRGVAECR